jgi:RNA polymerase primary sigma factor
MKKYRHNRMYALADQLKRGPRRLRLRQLLQIDFLLSAVEPDKEYPYEFVCHALTGYRTPDCGDGNGRFLDGESLISDLVALGEELSADARLSAEHWPEPLFGVEELAARLNVSTKTIFRWRRRGMAGWRFRGADERLRLFFPERCIRGFVGRNVELVNHGSGFSQLTSAERAQIVERARELAGVGEPTINAAAKVIAGETARAVETIRQVLRTHDEAHPRDGIFTRSAPDLDGSAQRLVIWEAHVDGVPIETLAERFEQPVGTIYATITHMRARALRAQRIEFIASEEFEAADAEKRILKATMPSRLRQPVATDSRRIPSQLPPYLASLFQIPLLTREGERVLFRKMNYLKYRAQLLIRKLDPETATAVELDRIEELLDSASRVKNEIVQANLRLVVSIARKHVTANLDLFELISDGNVSLMRAVEKFDYRRGFKFSTYGSWAIANNFARSIAQHHRDRGRYQTDREDLLNTADPRGAEEPADSNLDLMRRTIDQMLARLDERERLILRERYGLGDHGQPQTLVQIGRRFGLSKERIRQLAAQAMVKLRHELEPDVARLLGA